MKNSTIGLIMNIVLLPVSVQASDFEGITLKIMDADTVNHDISGINYALPEINLPDENMANASASANAASSIVDSSIGFAPVGINDTPGGVPDDLPPSMPSDEVPADQMDFPEDIENVDRPPIGGEIDDTPGGEPDVLPPNLPGDEFVPVDLGDLPQDNDG